MSISTIVAALLFTTFFEEQIEVPSGLVAITTQEVVVETGEELTLISDQIVILDRRWATTHYLIEEEHTHRYGFGRRTVPAGAIAWGMRFEEAVLACHGLHDRDLGLPTSVCFLDTDDDGMFDHAMFGRTSGREREPYSVRDFTGYEEIEPVPYTASPAFEVRPSENVWQLDRVRTRRNGAVEIYFRSGSGIDGERYRLTDGGVFIRHNTVGEAFLYRDDHVRIELNEFPVTLDFMTYQVIINGVNDDNSVAIEFHMRADGG